MISISRSTKAAERDPRQRTFHWIPAWALASGGGALKIVFMKVLFPFEVPLVVLVAMLIAIGSQGIFPSRGGVENRNVVSGYKVREGSYKLRSSQARPFRKTASPIRYPLPSCRTRLVGTSAATTLNRSRVISIGRRLFRRTALS